MTNRVSAPPTSSQYRVAGWAAVTSGVLGIMAFGLVFAAVMIRSEDRPHAGDLAFRSHDVAVILQSLLMIPVAFGLSALSGRSPPGVSRATLTVGVGALSSIVLFLALIFVNAVWDALYMVPQGVLGVWLMFVNWRLSKVLPRGLSGLGMVAGFGLLLVATFPVGYALFVEPVGLRGPDPGDASPPVTTANVIIHDVLLIGTFMGVLTYPIWSILLGRRLLRGEIT